MHTETISSHFLDVRGRWSVRRGTAYCIDSVSFWLFVLCCFSAHARAHTGRPIEASNDNFVSQSPISPIAMAFSVSLSFVSLCVGLYPLLFCVSTDRILTKVKNGKMTFIDCYICHCDGCDCYYSVILTYLFLGQIFQMLTSRKRWELAQKYIIRLLRILIFSIEWRHWESRTLWPWPTFSRSNISKAYIYETVRASSNNFDTALMDFDSCHQMAPFCKANYFMVISLERWELAPKCVTWLL